MVGSKRQLTGRDETAQRERGKGRLWCSGRLPSDWLVVVVVVATRSTNQGEGC